MITHSQLIRSVLGVVIGYIVFVVGAWVVQEVILGGVSYFDEPLTVALAGVLTPPSAFLGAWVTVAIARTKPFLHIMPMCILIAVETTYLYRTGKIDGPLWFEALAGGSLVIGAVIGAYCWRWWSERRHDSGEAFSG